eukprot:m.168982 g.168982  ORF g.168982 m.168982 type:complete len:485 (-) comp14492_c1_seq2:2442-3896(-)
MAKRPNSPFSGVADRACCICLETESELEGMEVIELEPCHHVHCRGCLTDHVNFAVANNKLPLTCATCTTPVPPQLVRSLLTPEEYERFSLMTLMATLRANPLVRFCPQPGCTNAVECASDMNGCKDVMCAACKNEFCVACRQPSHGDSACKVDMPQGCKPCPQCGVVIEKENDGSCNSMQCGVCKTRFCWLCMKVLSGSGYGHFSTMSGCTLYGRQPWSKAKARGKSTTNSAVFRAVTFHTVTQCRQLYMAYTPVCMFSCACLRVCASTVHMTLIMRLSPSYLCADLHVLALRWTLPITAPIMLGLGSVLVPLVSLGVPIFACVQAAKDRYRNVPEGKPESKWKRAGRSALALTGSIIFVPVAASLAYVGVATKVLTYSLVVMPTKEISGAVKRRKERRRAALADVVDDDDDSDVTLRPNTTVKEVVATSPSVELTHTQLQTPTQSHVQRLSASQISREQPQDSIGGVIYLTDFEGVETVVCVN